MCRKVFTIFILFCVSACTGPIVTSRQDPASTLRTFRQDILSSDSLSPDTLQALRMANFTQEQALRVGFDRSQKDEFERFASRIEQIYIESELAIGRAKFIESTLPERSLALYLLGARLSAFGLQLPECQGPFDLRCDSFKVFYAASIAPLVRYIRENKQQQSTTIDTGLGLSFSLNLASNSGLEDPLIYDSLVPSDTIGLEGLVNRHRKHGVGLALTGCRSREPDIIHERYVPGVGTCLPLTALLSFENCTDDRCDANLVFHNTFATDEADLHGVKVPLAADFTAPFASIIEKTGIGGWDGMLDAFGGGEELLRDTGFFTLEPYDPRKIPLITIHGLFSNPLTWLQVHNDLMGDPILRKNFQLWHYLYPTNLPILVNARTFREKFDAMHEFIKSLSPNQKGDGHVVVIAHSMGGLIARLSVIPDSEPLKQYYFVRADSLSSLDPMTKQEADSLLTFARLKPIKRVIFVAVPHRGSDIADNWIGTIGRWFISIPKKIITSASGTVTKLAAIMKPEVAKEFMNTDYSSIRSLSRKNPTLLAVADVPPDPAVKYHSIIGDRGRGNSPESSDGVVAYSSSHMEGAESELIVPADHTAHSNPLAIAEIRRILREHIESINRGK